MNDFEHKSCASLFPVAIISHAHPSISKGGAEIAAFSIFQGLKALNIPAIFVAAVPMSARHRVELGPDEYAIFYRPETYDHVYQLADTDIYKQLDFVIKKSGARLLNFHHFYNIGLNNIRDLCLGSNYHTVLTLHEFLAICHNHGQMVTKSHQALCSAPSDNACGNCFPDLGWRRMGMRADLFKETFKLFDHFISPSQFLVDRFAHWGLDSRRVTVIENGLAREIPARDQKEAPEKKSRWVFGYFGQVTPFKGVDLLLDAADILFKSKNFGATIEIRINGNIVGVSEEFRSKLNNSTNTINFLKFLGPYDNAVVLESMSECDYIVTPGVWWENSPVVIQEAYAAGRPIICTGIGGMAEKVQDQVTGLHFRRGDASDLARVISSATDEDQFFKMLKNIPRPYDATEMARRYLACFEASVAGISGKEVSIAEKNHGIPGGSVSSQERPVRSVRRVKVS